MNIDDLRKLNGIVVPDTTQQGDTVQGGTSNTPETCCPTSAETEEKKTSDTFIDPPEEIYSQTRNNDLGAIIDQDEDSVIEELTNEEYGDSHVYTQIEEENTQHKSSEYQTWSTKVGEFGDDNDEKKSDSIVTEDDERDVDMHLDMSMTERIKEYIRNLPDLWEVDFIYFRNSLFCNWIYLCDFILHYHDYSADLSFEPKKEKIKMNTIFEKLRIYLIIWLVVLLALIILTVIVYWEPLTVAFADSAKIMLAGIMWCLIIFGSIWYLLQRFFG